MKNNLPVMLLRGLVLLPNNDIRLEFENDGSSNIIDVAEMFHDNKLLVVTQDNPFEDNPSIESLPKIGVISIIKHKMILPNGKVRIIISGLKRSKVYEYLNVNKNNQVLESIVSDIEEEIIETEKEKVIIRKLTRELNDYIKMIPYVSNEAINLISGISNLSKFTDILVPNLSFDLNKMKNYLLEVSPLRRSEMILEDIYHEEELFEIEKSIDLKVKNKIDQTQKEYVLREKIKTIKEELHEISSKDEEIEKYKNRVSELNAPMAIKERLTKEIQRYESISSISPETSNIVDYINWLLDLPWNINTDDNDDLKEVRKELDKSHYGLEDIKTRIIEYLAVKKMTGSLNGPIICLVGPPGVGKTSLAYSIANAMNRKFVKMAVGGLNDESEIIGHRRTYLGANPGRIIQSMKKAGSNNPLFLIDEIDKMTKDIKGDPASSLLSVLDPEQNKYFSDNYIEEEFDLSKVLFIATANNMDNIPEPLKDRMEIVNISGYTELEKLDIAKNYLVNNICKEHGLIKPIVFRDDALLKIIRDYTKEAGVRELNRLLSKIVRKIVTSIVVNSIKVNSLNITEENVEAYLGKPKYCNLPLVSKIGVINGLAYTSYGGEILQLETNYFKGTGKLILTGNLGDVMKESAEIALSYIKANYEYFNIDYDLFLNNDIHIHVPEGAIPKDGPSAGVALTTSIISALTNMRIDSKYAMTGEMTLRGDVLPIGGLKEKSMGAYRAGVSKIFIPFDNSFSLEEIPLEIKEKIEYIPVRNYLEIFELLKES